MNNWSNVAHNTLIKVTKSQLFFNEAYGVNLEILFFVLYYLPEYNLNVSKKLLKGIKMFYKKTLKLQICTSVCFWISWNIFKIVLKVAKRNSNREHNTIAQKWLFSWHICCFNMKTLFITWQEKLKKCHFKSSGKCPLICCIAELIGKTIILH